VQGVFGATFQIGASCSPESSSANAENFHDLGLGNTTIQGPQNVRSIHFSRMMQTLGSIGFNQRSIFVGKVQSGLSHGKLLIMK
jgi:hypothetical protein